MSRSIIRVTGPYARPDGRLLMVLYYSDGSKSSTTYARWVKSQEAPIRPDQVVHHEDGTKDQDISTNLQVMTRSDHTRHHNPMAFVTLTCSWCGKEFKKRATRERQHNRKRTMGGPFCSRVCQGKALH